MFILNFLHLLPKLCLFLILVNFSIQASKSPSLPLNEYFAQTWDTRDGLPHNGINALAQSKDGYLWVATWEGLARFNGREFKVFTRGSAPGLPDSAIRSLYANSHGDLLVAGARGGVSERQGRSWNPLNPANALVISVIYDNQEGIWLGLEEKGLIYRDLVTQKDITVIDNLRVTQITQDHDDNLWVATSKGLFRVRNRNEVVQYGNSLGLPDSPVFSVMISRENTLYVGTKAGVYRQENNRFIPLDNQLRNESVTALMQDSNDDIWIGTTNHGVFRYSDNGIEKLDDNIGLPSNRILSMFEDQEKSIWIGTSSGLLRLRKAPFITLTSKQGLMGNYVRTVLSHSDGSLWVGSSKGLSHIVNGQISTVNTEQHITDISILSLAEDKQGEVLVGTYTQGVFKVVDNTLVQVKAINDVLQSQEIRSILIDSNENIWLGTTSGVVKVSNQDNIEYINQQSGLPANFIMTLAEDSLGSIWIGTGVGVASYTDGVLKVYRLSDKFDAEYAFGFYTEPKIVWMATDRGILRLDLSTNKIIALTKKNGLPIDKYFQVVIDKIGAMWLTSNRGIIKITKEEVERFITDNNIIIDYQLFTEDAGLLSSQANGGSTPAATVHSDGSFWVATANGVSQVTYERLNTIAEQKIPVTIEKLVVDGVNYPITNHKTITLPAGSIHIAIYYAGLGFLNADNIQYQTSLSGLDSAWQDKQNQTYSEFTNLSPGKYVFKMRAKYPDGKWREHLTKVNFKIEYFYWQTTAFKTLVILILLLVFYALYRYRLVKVKHNEARLKELVSKQTQELEEQARMFAHQASHDQLTGLPNRRAFDKWCVSHFKQAQSKKQGLSIAIVDIDHFKRVNDEYSHIIGDEVLKSVADILSQQVGNSGLNIRLARWGGEEFTLLIPGFKEGAIAFCDQLCQSIREHECQLDAPGLSVTISIGLSDNKDVKEYEKMISHADHALYCAKYNGRNQLKVYQDDSARSDKNSNTSERSRRRYD